MLACWCSPKDLMIPVDVTVLPLINSQQSCDFVVRSDGDAHMVLFVVQDINNAFLHGYIDEDIYMVPPEGYTKASTGQVCKLSKSLYGLKQESRQWNHELTKNLVSLGYVQSKHDYAFFVKAQGETFAAVLVYVDDMLLTGNSQFEILSLKNSLDKKFTIKDLGLAKYFLGIELCKTDTGMHLNQRKYILDLLTDAGLTGAKPLPFPLPT
ncbi:retrovirus-related pol polyprotein from transposon TNT 1-94 [Tanacetum coccineum]